MDTLNSKVTKWLIIIGVIIGICLIMGLFIKLLPFILLLLVGLWIYSKLTKFSFGKRKEAEDTYSNINDIPNNEAYEDAGEFDRAKVIDVDFVEEKEKK